jgi:hypothetical protein
VNAVLKGADEVATTEAAGNAATAEAAANSARRSGVGSEGGKPKRSNSRKGEGRFA